MKYNILGKSGLKISAIGFGGIPIQRLSQEEAVKVVEYALDKGINFIDSARGYSVSEKYIGQAIKNRRKEVVLATKGPSVDKEGFAANIVASLAAFDTPYVDLYQVHNVKDIRSVDSVFGKDGAYEAFEEFKTQGKVLHFGLTCHKKEILQYAIDNYGEKIESIMFPYNVVERQGDDLFESAAKNDIGVIAMKPLAGGNLTDTSLALRFCLSNPNVSVVIPGMAGLKEIDANTAVEFFPLTDEEKEICAKLVRQLGSSFCRRCGYCAPCTVGIDIPTCFTFENYLKNYDLADWAYERYAAMKVTADKCIKCGKCMERCPYELDIVGKLQSVAKNFEQYAKSSGK